jgi:glycine cleavage system aminomethyltransferase T
VTDAAVKNQAVLETPLADRHAALHARMIEFSGWRMPVQYTSILDEHRAVRERVGLFDLSHMGELLVEGPEAGPALAGAIVTNPPALGPCSTTSRWRPVSSPSRGLGRSTSSVH